jgi:hypothetical protein
LFRLPLFAPSHYPTPTSRQTATAMHQNNLASVLGCLTRDRTKKKSCRYLTSPSRQNKKATGGFTCGSFAEKV